MDVSVFFQTLGDAGTLVFTGFNLLVIPLGLIIGVCVGAMPGMSAPMGTALVLPFTFFMEPISALLLLLGVYKGGIYGGSIPAILFNTPGTVASSCTTLDGYPLTRQGKARKALDVALYASTAADVIANVALILFSGMLAGLALKFGAPETFALVFFALITVSSIAGDQIFRGLITTLLGLLVATVGMENFYGTQRFAFDIYDLWSGISVLPLLIGLFAVAEIMHLMLFTRRDEDYDVAPNAGGDIHLTWAEFKPLRSVVVRGSLIGTVLGAIPGIGAAAAAFFSYDNARRRSKNKDLFGKGSLEGIAAAESANNGVCSSSFIPVLALGIPGGTAAAVIMSAFIVHGITPGPILFRENLSLVYGLFIGLMLGSAALIVIGLVGVRVFSRMVNIPPGLLMPSVLAMCLFGAYASESRMLDVYIMIGAGVLGLGFRLLKLPAAPFLIGFILGPMLESAFRDTLMQNSGNPLAFLDSWIAAVFWTMSVITLFFVVRGHMRKKPDPVSSSA